MAGLLLTGATGFIGRSVAQALRRQGRAPLRALLRTPAHLPGFELQIGDLAAPSSVSKALEGIETVIHAASYVGADPATQWAVNTRGTENLTELAAAQGVRRIIYVSTASVFGIGPHRGDTGQNLKTNPASSLSASRLQAEKAVLAAGGQVIRPALTFGENDRWFIPGLLRIQRAAGGLVEGGRARISVIRVDHLGELIACFAAPTLPLEPGQALVAANVRPSTVREVVDLADDALGRYSSTTRKTMADALAVVSPTGITAHQLALVGIDHWYDAHRIWELAGLSSPVDLELRPRDAEWYRASLGR